MILRGRFAPFLVLVGLLYPLEAPPPFEYKTDLAVENNKPVELTHDLLWDTKPRFLLLDPPKVHKPSKTSNVPTRTQPRQDTKIFIASTSVPAHPVHPLHTGKPPSPASIMYSFVLRILRQLQDILKDELGVLLGIIRWLWGPLMSLFQKKTSSAPLPKVKKPCARTRKGRKKRKSLKRRSVSPSEERTTASDRLDGLIKSLVQRRRQVMADGNRVQVKGGNANNLTARSPTPDISKEKGKEPTTEDLNHAINVKLDDSVASPGKLPRDDSEAFSSDIPKLNTDTLLSAKRSEIEQSSNEVTFLHPAQSSSQSPICSTSMNGSSGPTSISTSKNSEVPPDGGNVLTIEEQMKHEVPFLCMDDDEELETDEEMAMNVAAVIASMIQHRASIRPSDHTTSAGPNVAPNAKVGEVGVADEPRSQLLQDVSADNKTIMELGDDVMIQEADHTMDVGENLAEYPPGRWKKSPLEASALESEHDPKPRRLEESGDLDSGFESFDVLELLGQGQKSSTEARLLDISLGEVERATVVGDVMEDGSKVCDERKKMVLDLVQPYLQVLIGTGMVDSSTEEIKAVLIMDEPVEDVHRAVGSQNGNGMEASSEKEDIVASMRQDVETGNRAKPVVSRGVATQSKKKATTASTKRRPLALVTNTVQNLKPLAKDAPARLNKGKKESVVRKTLRPVITKGCKPTTSTPPAVMEAVESVDPVAAPLTTEQPINILSQNLSAGVEQSEPASITASLTCSDEDVRPIHIWSSKDLTDAFARMKPFFIGKESDDNWLKRQSSIDEIRGMLLSDVHVTFKADFYRSLKDSILGCTLLSLASLRTTLASKTIALYCELIIAMDGSFDGPLISIILPGLLKMSGSTKALVATKTQNTVCNILENGTYQSIYVISLLVNGYNGEKNKKIRVHMMKHLETVLKVHCPKARGTSGMTQSMRILEGCLLSGLSDSCKEVKDIARTCFLSFEGLWPKKAAEMRVKMDGKVLKQLRG